MVRLELLENHKYLVNIESGLDSFFVPRNQVTELTKFIFNTMLTWLTSLFWLLLPMRTHYVILVYFFHRRRATNLIYINIYHFSYQILYIHFLKNDFVTSKSSFFLLNIYDCQESLWAGVEYCELCLSFLVNAWVTAHFILVHKRIYYSDELWPFSNKQLIFDARTVHEFNYCIKQ